MKITLVLLSLTSLVCLAECAREPKFAPYMYTYYDMASLKQKYGLRAITLSFVLAKDQKCIPAWDGTEQIDNEDAVGKINAFKAVGGDIIVASGGGAGYYLETACKTAPELAAAYKKVLAVCKSTHLDLDIEHSVNLDTVNQAVAQLQKETPALSFSLTIGADDNGITSQGVNFLKSSIKHGVNVDIVNTMAMDFESDKAWSGAVVDVVEATHKQLKKLWPQKNDQELYGMIGITPMIGRNDEGKTFTLDDARGVVKYAKSKGIGHLAFWALSRDNGKCPNEQGAPGDECSGIAQQDHEFTKIFSEFDK